MAIGPTNRVVSPPTKRNPHSILDFLCTTTAARLPCSPQPVPILLPIMSATRYHTVAADPRAFLDRSCAVHNWTSLGVFTGSRVGEYAQSKPTRGVPFERIPLNEDAGEWAGQPLAFIRSDFSFFDKAGRQLPTTNFPILVKSATEVHIRFRYDKSPTNFSS